MIRQKKNTFFGQDLVEFAIVLPILFLILMGIFDLGRIVYYYSSLTNAAREGARAGIIYPVNQNNIKSAVCYYSIGLDIGCPNPPAENVQISILDLVGTNDPDHIRVRVTYKFSPVTPVIGVFLDLDENNQITVSAQATMRIEN